MLDSISDLIILYIILYYDYINWVNEFVLSFLVKLVSSSNYIYMVANR